MTTTAVLFLLLSVLIVWGGLVASILRLRRDAREPHGHRDDGVPVTAPDA